MKNGFFTRTLCILLTLVLLLPLFPAALAEDAGDEPAPDNLCDIAMTPHPDGYMADPETMTDEEWAAQFACDTYDENNAATQLNALAADINPLDFVKMITTMKNMSDLMQKGAFWMLDFLWKGIMKGDGEDSKFLAIMAELKAIEKLLEDIKRDHKVAVYEQYLNNQLKERTKLAVDIRLIMNDLEDVDMALNKEGGKQITKAEAAKRRKAIIMRWGTSKIAGLSSGLAATMYYINYTMQLRIGGRNFIGMLDDYVYISLPWEHQGYEARELLRSAEMSTMFAALALSTMYLNLTGKTKTKTGREIAQLTQDVASWFEKQPVKREKDWAVCQIRGEQGSLFKRWAEDFSEQLDAGQTVGWNMWNRQFRCLIQGWDGHRDTRRKANVVPFETWRTLLNFYGNKKGALELYEKEMKGTRTAGNNTKYVSIYFIRTLDEVFHNNIEARIQYLNYNDKSIPDGSGFSDGIRIGFYWHANNKFRDDLNQRVRGWHRKPDASAYLIQYNAGKLVEYGPSEPFTCTISGPIAWVEDGAMCLLNATNEAEMAEKEEGEGVPPVMDAPEGGMVNDLFSAAKAYYGATMDIRALGLDESSLKPGQWVTATFTIDDNGDGLTYLATSVDPMDVAGVEGTISQLDDGAMTFLPDGGEELAFTLGDSIQLDADVREGGKALLTYHPELVYSEDGEGPCDHQDLVLDSITPLDPDELVFTGTAGQVDETGFAMTTDDDEPYTIDITEAEVEGELVEGSRVSVIGKLDGDEASMTENGPVVKASAVTAFAPEPEPEPDEDTEEMDGVILSADESTLQAQDDDGKEYAFDLSNAAIEGDTAEGNSVHVAYRVTAQGLEAVKVVCFAPDDDQQDDAADDPDGPEAPDTPDGPENPDNPDTPEAAPESNPDDA